ncbi:TIGR04282 family arsenosugar biosynthesis glycosyltransferase [Micromonospora peucetia]|uniref:TIGR04282 family arsenosugar biosynthesis glycosyltransferase n=1 Tax=Micromonospora peucetia TaxID=47871 RepID=UPI0022563675|nr:TIGR04282 family arsenosugar biosynthesis glycosyltransferase [Micromonospora peucetia]MCX4390826.1 TIGR04282 family arsenosugar biosynthesis glycosyltransferase [Micromonospora peucetia]
MTVLLVMAKAPVPGAVKTRLGPPATPGQAARLAAAALLDTIDAARATPGVTAVLALSGRIEDAEAGDELSAALVGWSVLPQRGGGLGERLANAYADVAESFPGHEVVQVGMDTPQLTPARLRAAIHRLASTDAVLGRAVDGGWWALGLRDPRHAVALRDVPMSTPQTARHTWAALVGRGLRVAPLPVLRDVDVWTDALAVAAEATGSRFARQVATLRPALVPGGLP